METTLIRDMGKKIYHKIPAFLRWFFWPIKLAFKLINISKLDLWIMSGEEITSYQKLSIIYAGEEINRNYFAKLAYDKSFSENYLGKVWLWKIFKVIREKGHNYSLMVVAVDGPFCTLFGSGTYFNIPFWVSSLTNISADSSLLTKSDSAKTDIRKIRNSKLSSEITQDRSQFDNFYYNMYRPYIAAAHGARAIIVEHDCMKNEFKNNELLLIKKGNEYIAGTLLVYKKRQCRLVYMGVKGGNFDYVKDGAVGAIFHYAIHRFKEKGYKEVDFGGSRAFLKDGVLHYKKKRGASRISYSSWHGGIFFVELLTNTPGLKAFLLNNPFIFVDKRKINGAVFVDCDRGFSQEEIGRIYKDYYFDGMSNLYIYHFGDNSKRLHEIPTLQFSDRDRVRFCAAEKLFRKDR